MNYNDFPILDDNAYQFLKEQYNTHEFSRDVCVDKIFFNLHECKSCCLGLADKLNLKLTQAIKACIEELDKILNNLDATFNFNKPAHEIKEINIFSLLNKLVVTASNFNLWQAEEEKEYFKQLANNNLKNLLKIIENIINALENSNFYLFKHM